MTLAANKLKMTDKTQLKEINYCRTTREKQQKERGKACRQRQI